MSLDVLVGDGRTPAPPDRRRTAVIAVLLVLGLALLVRLAWPGGSGTPLAPDNPGASGTQALAQVLRQQGVDVELVRSRAELDAATIDDATTLVVSSSPSLTEEGLEAAHERLPDAGRGVFIGLGSLALVDLDLPIRPTGGDGGQATASCDADVADVAARIEPADRGYALMTSAQVTAATLEENDPDAGTLGASWPELVTTPCYPAGDEGHALLTIEPTSDLPRVDLLAPGALVTNEAITTQDDAALALLLLGSEERVVWYAADLTDLGAGGTASGDPRVVPDWFAPLVVLLGGAGALTMWWRGRRLGPLAVEPLPVLVPASETTLARGRLYRRSRGRGHAASALRAATRRRLAERLGLPRHDDVAALAAAVAAATGRDADAVHALLDGPEPSTDTDLSAVAADLARLEEEVRR